jgi:hypothetical protein
MGDNSVVDNLSAAIETFTSRNSEYGNAFERHGKIMKQFFPDGIELKSNSDFQKFQVFQAIVGKLNRYASSITGDGHIDSIHDAISFCAMLEKITQDHIDEK